MDEDDSFWGAYESLAKKYDCLTEDVAYPKRADFVEKLFSTAQIPVHTVLDLACGTGTMTALLTERGYEMIGVDASAEMLQCAQEKSAGLSGIPPLYLQQPMQKLDLYGTVDAVICCLDSINYLLRSEDVRRTFERVHLFLAPGGAFVFDVHAPAYLKKLDGQTFVDEKEDCYCVWTTLKRKRNDCIDYMLDLFLQERDGRWRRTTELHTQRPYTREELTGWLRDTGFADIRVYGDCRLRRPKEEERMYFRCIRK